jgi:hypothetical protein
MRITVSQLRRIIRETVEETLGEKGATDEEYEDILIEGFFDTVKTAVGLKPKVDPALVDKMKASIAAGDRATDVLELTMGEILGTLSKAAEDPSAFGPEAEMKMLKDMEAASAALDIAMQMDDEHREALDAKAREAQRKYRAKLGKAVAVLAGDAELARMLNQLDDMKASNLTKAGKKRKVRPYTTSQISALSKQITAYCSNLLSGAGMDDIDVIAARSAHTSGKFR